MATKIKFKRKVVGSSYNEVLETAEPLYDIATKHFYVGDGTNTLSDLDYIGKTAENVSSTINGKSISSIFESNGTTAKKATSATSATKIGATTVGSTARPIYLSSGTPTLCNTYAGGTAVVLNNTPKGASSASFYAPEVSGTSGQILLSSGSGNAPVWGNSSDLSVQTATYALNDGFGENITDTYGAALSKEVLGNNITLGLLNKNGVKLDSVTFAVGAGGNTYQAGTGINIANSEISIADMPLILLSSITTTTISDMSLQNWLAKGLPFILNDMNRVVMQAIQIESTFIEYRGLQPQSNGDIKVYSATYVFSTSLHQFSSVAQYTNKSFFIATIESYSAFDTETQYTTSTVLGSGTYLVIVRTSASGICGVVPIQRSGSSPYFTNLYGSKFTIGTLYDGANAHFVTFNFNMDGTATLSTDTALNYVAILRI